MTRSNLFRAQALALCMALLVGCSLSAEPPAAATAQPTAAGDAVATQVAIAQAVAATLTAAVPVSTPETSEPAEATPTIESTEEEPPTEAPPTPEPPTEEAPTPEPPTEEPAPLPRAYAPPGNAGDVVGGIIVPDDARIASYSEGNDLEVVFRSPLWFSVQAYVPSPDGNNVDGAGVAQVQFSIVGPTTSGESDIIHERIEQNAAFCVFGGGEPDCEAWDFAANDNRWPNGEPVQFGENYHVQINVDGAEGIGGASWNFNFTIEAPE